MGLRSFAIGLAAFLMPVTSFLAVPVLSGELRNLIMACTGDYHRFCPDTPLGGNRVAECLSEHREVLSSECRSAIGGVENRYPSNSVTIRDLAYGSDPAQQLDVYHPANARGAPIILMVHGGAWVLGDKAAEAVVENKVAHWVPKGVIFISANYRLLPDADPVKQAEDVARALAFAQFKARSWGGDPRKIVLMGHSSGAHLVSLLASDPKMAYREGASPWLGTIALDSAAMDVVKIMENRHLPLYDRAFGANPAYWRLASPAHRLKGKRKPMLIVCSSQRTQPCNQADLYAEKAGKAVDIIAIPLSHREINDNLGEAGEYTARIDAFLLRLGVPVGEVHRKNARNGD